MRRQFSRAAGLLAVTFAAFFCFALLQACRLLCCNAPSTEPLLGKGFRHLRPYATQNTGNEGQKERRKWTWGHTQIEDEGLAELSAQARAEARSAMEKELAVQVKVRAALERQVTRHKTLLKQLEVQGWHLSAADKISMGSLKQRQQSLQRFLQSQEYKDLSLERRQEMSGRGIVMAAGGPVPLANAYVALHMLRHVHNCSLPVELFYNGPHELDRRTKVAFEREFGGLRCINIAEHEVPVHQMHASGGHALSQQQSGWVLKAQMLAATSFAEVLVLDADNVPLADPAFLFDSAEYQTSGNLFWPDFWSSNWHNPGPVYRLFNLTTPWEGQPNLLTTESGQLLLDRRRHAEVVEWIMFLNLHADMLYAIIWGDKDTYRLAFSLAGQASNFTQVERQPANALRVPWSEVGQDGGAAVDKEWGPELWAYLHAGMLQMAPSGQMLFLHRTAGSKLDPRAEYPEDFMAVDYITPPLTPRQAAQVHNTGPMAASKFDATRAGACPASEGLNLMQAAVQCGMVSGGTGKNRTDRQDSHGLFPIPLFGTQDFPGLQELLQSSTQAFKKVQQRFKAKQLPLGLPG